MTFGHPYDESIVTVSNLVTGEGRQTSPWTEDVSRGEQWAHIVAYPLL
jgi:hypothetical protein